MTTTTPDGMLVEIGQVWQDMDKRMGWRALRVVGFSTEKEGRAIMAHPRFPHYPKTRISIRRLTPKCGWRLVEDQA